MTANGEPARLRAQADALEQLQKLEARWVAVKDGYPPSSDEYRDAKAALRAARTNYRKHHREVRLRPGDAVAFAAPVTRSN